jgi:hypothetical protein
MTGVIEMKAFIGAVLVVVGTLGVAHDLGGSWPVLEEIVTVLHNAALDSRGLHD